MKKFTKIIALTAAAALSLSACVGRPKVPEDWYKKTIQYYTDGFSDGWKNEKPDLDVAEEMKDPSKQFGYLLKDLDGDGTVEVLVGVIDDSPETKFIDLYIWHSDIGAFRIFHSGDDYYMYLCENNIIRMDSWHGSTPEIRYMSFNPENNSFKILDQTATPQHCELTPF